MPNPGPPKRPQGILRQDSESRAGDPECASPSSYLGLKSHQSPKSVIISNEPEVISPLLLGEHKTLDSECDLEPRPSPRRVPVKGYASKRLSGRLPFASSTSLNSNLSASQEVEDDVEDEPPHSRPRSHRHLEDLIDQVSQWIRDERSKHSRHKNRAPPANGASDSYAPDEEHELSHSPRKSHPTESSFDLDKLEDIIKHNLTLERKSRHSRNRSPTFQRRRASLLKSQRKQSTASSDTDTAGGHEGDTFVPSCDVLLDNSQTLSYTGGVASDSNSSSDELERSTSYKDLDAWAKFKFEIVRLTHTLRLKSWRRVPMNMSNEIAVERLSGALTNAVYVVTPPMDLPEYDGNADRVQPRNPPPKLLLRIYGPNVDHLIDREAELAILRRLAKKKIGPSLLGTFANGRFEEYFYAKTLTPDDLRDPVTSRQIAKRMRELHDGVELLYQEREDGAFVWRNWDKWVHRVERITVWLDSQIAQLKADAKPSGTEAWKRRGYICGVPWNQFRKTVEGYRKWLEGQYGGVRGIRKQLVFAHNDTQYGNILRLMPTGDSPLLLPANSHKQLVVIDFEYASANMPGLEFANHFTEWCYNYHDARKPYAFHAGRYPTPEEQDRFIRAYVRHRPQYNVKTPTFGPVSPAAAETPSRRPTSTISDFMLDARAPSSTSLNHQSEEAQRKESEDEDVVRLMDDTRMWRLANTAQWVAWGIVQAKVPGMPDFDDDDDESKEQREEQLTGEELAERAEVYKHLTTQQQEGEEIDGSEKEEAEEEFDYLGYAQHRAMFFWADVVRLGLVDEKELPEETRGKLKKVPY